MPCNQLKTSGNQSHTTYLVKTSEHWPFLSPLYRMYHFTFWSSSIPQLFPQHTHILRAPQNAETVHNLAVNLHKHPLKLWTVHHIHPFKLSFWTVNALNICLAVVCDLHSIVHSISKVAQWEYYQQCWLSHWLKSHFQKFYLRASWLKNLFLPMLKTCYYSNSHWQVWRNHWPQNLIKSINIANNKLFHRIHTGNLAVHTSLPDSTQLTFNCCHIANHALDLLNAQLSSAAWSTDSMATSELKWQNMGETNCLSQS